MRPKDMQLHRNILRTLERQYDCALMNNVNRSVYVECLIAEALDANLPWLDGEDWAPWDLECCGHHIEVKQSAAMQPWQKMGEKRSRPSFDIAARSGHWTSDGDWTDTPGRQAAIYVFAWHSEEQLARADHRRADQWRFFIVAARDLPEAQKSIGLAALAAICSDVSYADLRSTMKQTMRELH